MRLEEAGGAGGAYVKLCVLFRGYVCWGIHVCKMSSVITGAASPTRWTRQRVRKRACAAYAGEYAFQIASESRSDDLLEQRSGSAVNRSREGGREGGGRTGESGEGRQGRILARLPAFQCLDLERCCRTPSQFSPCVGDTRSGPFTFPLCAKLSWCFAMNRTRTRTHTQSAAVRRTNAHAAHVCLPACLVPCRRRSWETGGRGAWFDSFFILFLPDQASPWSAAFSSARRQIKSVCYQWFWQIERVYLHGWRLCLAHCLFRGSVCTLCCHEMVSVRVSD